jgi:methionyl-tRNA formyltransferase
MEEKVDMGKIVEERTFAVLQDDTVETLKLRTMKVMTELYGDIVRQIAKGKTLPTSHAKWSRKPFTRKQLNELAVIKPDMDQGEIRRRVRAMTYPGYPGPFVTLGGITFSSDVPNRKPLA